MDAHPEHKYIEALLNNDSEEIEKIYSQYSGLVKVYVLNNSGTQEEAKDLFQDTLVDLHKKAIDGFVLTCAFKPYFMGMCRYKWLDNIKSVKKRKEKEFDAIKVTNSENEGLEYIQAEIKDYFRTEKKYTIYKEHFSKLSTTCQEIVGLLLVKNERTNKTNSLKEIAELLKLNYSYVRREKNNCIERLIASIKNDSRYENL